MTEPAMATLTQTLANIQTAASRVAAAELLRNCVGAPGPASLRQLIAGVLGVPGIALTVPETQAIALIEQFGTRVGPIRFTHLQRGRVAMQLMARVLQPGMINQGAFGMCGPAAVAIDTARNNPVGYVTFAISLCENGSGNIGGRMVTPVAGIRTYLLSEVTTVGMPQADWVVLASLRDDPASLQGDFSRATYGGSSSDEVFDWMVRCGFQKVIGMSHITLANSFRAHPVGLLPPTMSSSSKQKTLETAADLSRRGWRIFMQGFMQLARGIEQFHAISASETHTGVPQPVQRATAITALRTENPGAVGTVFNVVKGLTGFSGGDMKHWTYVEALTLVLTTPGSVTIACCNHGVRYADVTLPMDAFLNKFLGFVAVTDYA